ncbi:MAG TPA: hypothetical protein VFI31_11700 [Pirellulales bacterium]|nr:hypothetical protein [Pirellulales bacterium]
MTIRFQFSLRALLLIVAGAAVITWTATVIGVGTATGLMLAFLGIGAVYRRPLEGGIGFLAVTMAALCGGLVYDGYYVQLHTVNSVLDEFPEIDNVWLCTNDDVMLEVEGLWFSTVDQPKAVFGVEGGSTVRVSRKSECDCGKHFWSGLRHSFPHMPSTVCDSPCPAQISTSARCWWPRWSWPRSLVASTLSVS